MEISHFHVYVKNRSKAVEWLKKVWYVTPVEEDHEMSMFTFGSIAIIINDSEEDVPSTIAFGSKDCDHDYEDVIARGAISIQEPENKPWGVRIAFVQGPGKLTFEIEEVLQKNKRS
ncbi:MAG: hypothetical protein V3U24_05315 [Candidatus Neomarinimicrobiota bacterium]